MRVIDLLPFALLAATVAAVPQGKPGMRLIKTSEDAPAIWVTEDEKFDLYMAKRIHFIDITDTQDLEAIGAELHAASLEKRQSTGFPANPTRQTEVRNLQASINTNNIRTWMTTFTGYYNRYYGSTYGVQASNWLFEQVKTQAAANSKITVRQVTHSSFSQKSIVARIPGTGTGVIVIGAHLDSVGSTRAGRSPGADDNASGSLTILETLRILAAAKFAPTNSIEFHWYAGEEGGLLGSRDIMRSYASARTNVKAMLNQDMTGYSPNNQFGLVMDYTNLGLNLFMEKLVTAYTSIPVRRTLCDYGCSDHASANASGYASAMVFEDVFESSNPYIHSASDTMDRVDFNHVKEHVKLTVGFAVEGAYF